MGGGPDYAVLLPGSASSADFLARAFAPLIGGAQVCEVPTRSGDARGIASSLGEVAAGLPDGARVTVVGVSLGAHAAALWAAGAPLAPAQTDVVLALPAWTGSPEAVAALSAAAADQLGEAGVEAELARLTREFGDDWVAVEVTAAWRGRQTDDLVATLRATAASPSATLEQLGRIRLSTTVLALAGDPMHPEAVARQWAAAIPDARLAVVGRDEPAADVSVLGRAVLAARARS